MKYLFLFLPLLSFGQIQKPTKTDTVVINLTAWQKQQFEIIEAEKKKLNERAEFLFEVIADANGVAKKDIDHAALKPGKIIIVRKKED